MPHPAKRQERNRNVYLRFQAGESLGVLARECGVSRQRLYQIVKNQAKAEGMEIRQHIGRSPRKVLNLRAHQVKGLANGTVTVDSLARELNVSRQVVRRHIEENGLTRGALDHRSERNKAIFAAWRRNTKVSYVSLARSFGGTPIAARNAVHRYAAKAGIEVPRRCF